MKGRYEIRNDRYPSERGERSTELERARRKLAQLEAGGAWYVAGAGRWYIFDRLERCELEGRR